MSAAELILATGSAPTAPATGRLTLYADEGGGLYIMAADGQAYRLATANGDLVLAAGAQLTVPTSGTAVLRQGSPTVGRVAQWQDEHTLGQCDIRVGSSGAVGIGVEPGVDAAGNLAVGGDVQVQGSVEAHRLILTNSQCGERVYTLNISTPPVDLELVTVTLNSSSDGFLLDCRILLCGTNNFWGVYTGYASAGYASGIASFQTKLQIDQTNGTVQSPILSWSGSGNTRTVILQNNQLYSLLVAHTQVVARGVEYEWA